MTGFQLPTYTAPGQAWQLSDYKSVTLTSPPVGSDGTATATGPQIDGGYMWSIQRAVCSSTSTAPTQVRLYDSSAVSAGALLSGSNSGNYDEADYPAGLLVEQSRQLVAVWSGGSAGAVGTLRLQVAVLKLAG